MRLDFFYYLLHKNLDGHQMVSFLSLEAVFLLNNLRYLVGALSHQRVQDLIQNYQASVNLSHKVP
jgi:hypothetical protein